MITALWWVLGGVALGVVGFGVYVAIQLAKAFN